MARQVLDFISSLCSYQAEYCMLTRVLPVEFPETSIMLLWVTAVYGAFGGIFLTLLTRRKSIRVPLLLVAAGGGLVTLGLLTFTLSFLSFSYTGSPRFMAPTVFLLGAIASVKCFTK